MSQAQQIVVEPSAAVVQGAGLLRADHRMFPYDVRLRRELTHRRLAVSLVRRLLRVLSLHLLDGMLLAGVVLMLSGPWGVAPDARPLTPAIVTTFLVSLNALSAYRPGDARRDRGRLAWGTVLALLILAGLVVFPPHVPLSYSSLAALGGAGFVALALGRKAADLVVRQAYVHGIGLRRAVVLGSLDEAGKALQELRDDQNIDQYVVGHLAPDDRPDPAALGAVADLPRILEGMDIQEVLVATSLPAGQMRSVAACCFERGIALFIVPAVAGSHECWTEPLRVGSCSLLRLHPARFELPALLVKRAVDLGLALLALVAAAPLIALIAAAIRLDSPGPVFFRQQRIGLGGKPFRMWKFRSMAVDAERRERELAHLNIYGNRGTFKLKDDPRITRVGRLLRRTSMDELPQLLNVLTGDMSLVGPRPALLGDIDRYEPHHFERLMVVPGMTGPWQVSGRNLITDFETIVRMERDYIRGWSLLLDIKILFRTIGVVIRGEGAY
jgi:exopolysaccharide biosynthesis polyprenyl glycosylphosphotransferase